MDNTPDIISPTESAESTFQPVETPYKTIIERNKDIIADFAKGIVAESIALKYGLSKPQIYNIVRNNPSILSTNRELEKMRKIRRLRLCENKAPKSLAPRNVTELVAVIKAQDDIDRPDAINNINIDNRTINMASDPLLLQSIQSINSMFAKLLGEPIAVVNSIDKEKPKPYSLLDRHKEILAERQAGKVGNGEGKESLAGGASSSEGS